MKDIGEYCVVQLQVDISWRQFLQWRGLLMTAEDASMSVIHCRTALLYVDV